jgi:hypothetical protein
MVKPRGGGRGGARPPPARGRRREQPPAEDEVLSSSGSESDEDAFRAKADKVSLRMDADAEDSDDAEGVFDLDDDEDGEDESDGGEDEELDDDALIAEALKRGGRDAECELRGQNSQPRPACAHAAALYCVGPVSGCAGPSLHRRHPAARPPSPTPPGLVRPLPDALSPRASPPQLLRPTRRSHGGIVSRSSGTRRARTRRRQRRAANSTTACGVPTKRPTTELTTARRSAGGTARCQAVALRPYCFACCPAPFALACLSALSSACCEM